MKTKAAIWTILVGLILGGIAYWTQSYSQLNIQESSIIPTMWTVGSFFGALILMFLLKKKPWRLALLISCGFILAVFGRIVYDLVFIDPTHHNLAPFEIIICGIFVLPCSFAGAYLSLLIKKMKN